MQGVVLCADVKVAEREGTVAIVEEAILKMAEVDVLWSGCHDEGDASRQLSWQEVDAVRAVMDVEERQRHNRGRWGGNDRVDAEVDAGKPHVHRGVG
jgi:hypothetical protein